MKSRILLITVVLVLATGLLLAACAQPATTTPAQPATTTPAQPATAPITLKFATYTNKADTVHIQAQQWFCDEVAKRTNGRVKFEIYWGQSLLKMAEMLNGIETGLADAGEVPCDFSADRLPMHAIVGTFPFVTSHPAKLIAYDLERMDKIPGFAKEIEAANQVTVGFIANPPYELVARIPIATLDDLKGKKIGGFGRAVPTWLTAAGATGVSVSGPEAFEALQKGVIDGRVFSAEGAIENSLWDVAGYYVKVGFGCITDATAWTINKNVWEQKLSKDEQGIILQIGKDAKDWVGPALEEELAKNDQLLKQKGMQIIEFSSGDKQAWSNLLKGMQDKWIADMAAKGIPGQQLADMWLKYQD